MQSGGDSAEGDKLFFRLETDRNSYHQNPSDYQIQFIDGKNWVVWCNTIKWCLQKKTNGSFPVPICLLIIDVWVRPRMWNTQKLRQNGQITGQNPWLWVMSPCRRLERHWDLEIPMANFHQRCVWTRQHTWHSPRTRSICFHHRDPLGASKWTDQMLKMQRILGPSWTIMDHLKIMLNRYHYINYIIHITYYRYYRYYR